MSHFYLYKCKRKLIIFNGFSELFFDRVEADQECDDATKALRRKKFDYLVRTKVNNLNKRRAARPRRPRVEEREEADPEEEELEE